MRLSVSARVGDKVRLSVSARVSARVSMSEKDARECECNSDYEGKDSTRG